MNRIKKDVNYIQNLVEYTKRNLKKGYAPDSLKWALINQGHSRIEVDKAISTAQAEIAKESVRQQARTEVAIEPQIEVDVEPKPSFWKRFFS